MNCLLLASYAAPYAGNFIPSVLLLSKSMRARGHRLIFVFPKEAQEKPWAELMRDEKVYYIDYRPYSPSTVSVLKKIIKDESIDINYSHFGGWDIPVKLAAPFKPCVWHCRMNLRLTTTAKKAKYFVKYKVIGFGKTYSIAVSKPVGRLICSFISEKRCDTVENGINFSRLTTLFREPKREKKLLMMGWAPYVKGVDTVCAAFEKNSENKKLLLSCQSATNDFLTERYGGTLPSWLETLEPTDDISRVFEKSDIFISASTTEAFSCSLAEALYSGLPCLVSDIDGTNWSHRFKNVFVFKTSDPDSLLEETEKCMKQAVTKEDVGYNVELLKNEYSVEQWAEKIVGILEKRMK